jgi:hypothetical protein
MILYCILYAESISCKKIIKGLFLIHYYATVVATEICDCACNYESCWRGVILDAEPEPEPETVDAARVDAEGSGADAGTDAGTGTDRRSDRVNSRCSGVRRLINSENVGPAKPS